MSRVRPWDGLKVAAKRHRPRMGSDAPSPWPRATAPGTQRRKCSCAWRPDPRTPPQVRPVGLERTGSAFDATGSQTSPLPARSRPLLTESWSGGNARLSAPTAQPAPAGGTGSPACPQVLVSRDRGGACLVKVTEIILPAHKDRSTRLSQEGMREASRRKCPDTAWLGPAPQEGRGPGTGRPLGSCLTGFRPQTPLRFPAHARRRRHHQSLAKGED